MTKSYQFSYVYHLVDERNLQSIQANGLLSAAQLLERAGLAEWIYHHRDKNIELPNGVVIRDQRPMPPTALARCLAPGLTPRDWYALLNRRIFFWIDLKRLDRQRQACTTPQYIMTLDAKNLLTRYASHASVTPINTGNARRAPARRGLESFVPYDLWLNSGWASEAEALGTKPRLLSHKPVELTITDTVPDIFDFVLGLRRFEPGELLAMP